MYDKNILKLMYCNQHHYWTKNNLTFGLFGDEHSISSETKVTRYIHFIWNFLRVAVKSSMVA